MTDQSFDVSYRAAMDAATGELDSLFEEAKRLRNRMEQIDEAIGALKYLLELSESGSSQAHWMSQQLDPALGVAAVA